MLLYHVFGRQAVVKWPGQSVVGLSSEVQDGCQDSSAHLLCIVILMNTYHNIYARQKA